jgi:prepilin-type N-terminal cleavage/methylation domain-containing protein
MVGRRTGFTLVEMMVAMTLTVFVMVILSQCFVAGLETFSSLKAVGDMQEELRTATNMLRADLSADHFEGKRRLSDLNLKTERIREGFFAMGQGYPPTAGSRKVNEGNENGVPSFRATDHWLHFTVKLRGNARERFFAAPAPGVSTPAPNLGRQSPDVVFQENVNVLHSAWGEVAYIVLPTGTTVNPQVPGGAGTPLYALYRCAYVVPSDTSVLNSRNMSASPDGSPYIGIAGQVIAGGDSGRRATMRFVNPNDLASGYPGRSFNPHSYFQQVPTNNKNLPRGAALVLSNVLSFQVQALKFPSATGEFEDLGLTAPQPKTNRPLPIPFDTANYVNGPALPPTYGGGAALTPPSPPYSIVGLQIVLRIWDPKSRLTRQVTLLQDM